MILSQTTICNRDKSEACDSLYHILFREGNKKKGLKGIGMKVALVNTICGAGSVGRICVDLYDTMKTMGHEPYMIAGRGEINRGMHGYVIGNKADFVCHVLKNFFQGKAGFGSRATTLKFIDWLKQVKPDVIHLHNIHGFYLQIELLFDYIKKENIPVVWTLHDCWSFTGHCAYFDYIECEKWKTDHEGCHNCPIHRSAYPYALFKDNSVWSYARKKETFTGVKNMTIVTPSQWLADLVKQSFLQEYPVKVIPNGINLEQFVPLTQQQYDIAKKQKKGYAHKTVLGVANRWEERKGLVYFEKLIDMLPDNYTVELIGLNDAQKAQMTKKYPSHKFVAIDRTKNVELLAAVYRNADVYVNATLEDNFPTTNLEALACGTPVVTFDTGGSRESLDETCGIAVPKRDIDALCQAVRKVCEEEPFKYTHCRKRAMLYKKEDRFTEYIHLYEAVLHDKKE